MRFDTFLRRPVLALVVNLIIVMIGVIAFDRLTIRQIPDIDVPVVNIATTYPGANAGIVETQITKPLEDAIAGIDGVDFVQAISRAESSQVTVYFQLDKSPEVAAADVRDRVSRARGTLPPNALEPIVQKQEADAQPIVFIALHSDRHSTVELTEIAHGILKDRLQAIPGVAETRVFGNRYAMRVWLDPARLAGAGLTPEDVENALRSQNVEIPAGAIESADREFTVFAKTRLQSAADFEKLVVKEVDGYLVRLGDVSRVELGGDRAKFKARYNGRSAVPIGLVRLASANPIEIAAHLREALPKIAPDLPKGVQAEVAYDTTVFIERSVRNVIQTIGEAMVLVVVVIFVFLRSWRATLIPLVTIPVSLVGTFAFMLLCGFSINTLSLLAMVLAIGLVVDDAIVVLENIHRQVERGASALDAARRGLREVGRPVIAMTVTLAAVYLPLAVSNGRTGKLFTEFALTLAFAVVLSGVAALTLTPVMTSRLIGRATTKPARPSMLERGARAYGRRLEWALRRRALVVSVAVATACIGVLCFTLLPREVAPAEDQGVVIQIATAPEGSTIEYTDRQSKKVESILSRVPEGDRVFELVGMNGVTSAVGFVGLMDWDRRERSAQDVAASLMPGFMGVSGLNAFPVTPPPLGQGGVGQPISLVVQTTGSWESLAGAVESILARLRENPRLVAIDTDLKPNKPEIRLHIDNDKVAAVGSDYGAVGRAVETMLGGRRVTRFNRGSEQHDVIVQVDDASRSSPAAFDEIHVRTRGGTMLPLANFVASDEVVSAKELNHYNKLRAATITAGLAPGYAQGDALDWVEREIRRVAPDVQIEFTGQAREFRRASSDFVLLAALAVIFIYLVLAAQFESFVDPMIVLLSVPLAVTGALGMLVLLNVGASFELWHAKGSWNIYTQIGLVTLVGLIAKHGILIVEFANKMVDDGMDRPRAVVGAAVQRLRPILMTTAAMVLGAIPLAFASGAGAEARRQIGWVIVGGLTVGTLLTLFLVPVAYVLISTQSANGTRPKQRNG